VKEIDPDIFRAYDIRGTVPDQINADVIRQIARGYASLFQQPEQTTLVVGRDLRPSSEELAQAAIEGLVSCGCHVIDIGQTPTPVLYFAIGIWGADGGLGITASHKPPQFNGMKVRWGDRPFYGKQLQELRRATATGDFPCGHGSVESRDIWPEYFSIAKSQISAERPVRVVLDAGNGCGVFNGPQLLQALGCELTVIFGEPDGTFPLSSVNRTGHFPTAHPIRWWRKTWRHCRRKCERRGLSWALPLTPTETALRWWMTTGR